MIAATLQNCHHNRVINEQTNWVVDYIGMCTWSFMGYYFDILFQTCESVNKLKSEYLEWLSTLTQLSSDAEVSSDVELRTGSYTN